MKKLIYPILLFCSLLNAQSYDDKSKASELCFSYKESIGNNFMSNKEADNALDKILSVIGASKNFVLQPCNGIDNAIATAYEGVRYILYDNDFINEIASQSDSWTQMFILAHEVGHHINGHSLDILLHAADVVESKSLKAQRQQELESDEFAGFVLAKLGATLEQASEVMNMIASDRDDTFSTHPNKTKRLNAIKNGYNKALGNRVVVYEEKLNSAKEYYKRGQSKVDNQDYTGAIEDFTKAIELKPFYEYYWYRAWCKDNLEDYQGALVDYNYAIELNPNEYNLFHNRGRVKSKLKKYYGAIADYTKAIELKPDFDDAYFERALSKFYLDDYAGAIADNTKAIELNPNYGEAYFNKGIILDELKDYGGAIFNFTKSIELNPDSKAYYNRGLCEQILKNHKDAIVDFTKAINLSSNKNDYYYISRAASKCSLDDYYGAIADCTEAIELNPNCAEAFLKRGLNKFILQDYSSACEDFNKAEELGDKDAAEWASNRQCNSGYFN